MSQQKVDKYKEYKKNRKEIIAKEKRKKMIGRVVAWIVLLLVVCGIVGMIGFSAYNSYQAKVEEKPNYNATDFELADFAGITATEASEEAEDIGSEEEASADESKTDTSGEAK